jgi:hypothetical protein
MKADPSFGDVQDDASVIVFEVHVGNSPRDYAGSITTLRAGHCYCHDSTSISSLGYRSPAEVLRILELTNETKLSSTVTVERQRRQIENRRLGGDEAMKFYFCASGGIKLERLSLVTLSPRWPMLGRQCN